MSEEEIHQRLTQVRGIGEWSVQMFLMFRLGRPDVLPIHDLGIRKGFQIVYGQRTFPNPNILEDGERWRPYRSIASWYLWRAVDQKNKKKLQQRKPRKSTPPQAGFSLWVSTRNRKAKPDSLKPVLLKISRRAVKIRAASPENSTASQAGRNTGGGDRTPRARDPCGRRHPPSPSSFGASIRAITPYCEAIVQKI